MIRNYCLMVTPLYQRNVDQKYKTKFNVDDLFKLKKMAFEIEIALTDRDDDEKRKLKWKFLLSIFD